MEIICYILLLYSVFLIIYKFIVNESICFGKLNFSLVLNFFLFELWFIFYDLNYIIKIENVIKILWFNL